MRTVRVLFSSTAGAGHFDPMVPLARACAAAGHEVVAAAPQSFADHVRGANLRHLPFPDVPAERIGAVYGRLASLPQEEAEGIVVGEVFGRLDAQAALPTMLEVMAEWRPDVVVRDPVEFGALAAAARHGVPQVQVAISVARLLENAAGWLDEPLRELETLAGLDAPQGAARVLATPTLSSVPPTLDDAVVGASAERGRVWRYRSESPVVGPSLPGRWGDPSAPLVYVTFGSVAGALGRFDAVYPGMVEALADQPVRVLLTTGRGYDLAQLGTLPDNTWAAQWWPQAAAMREAAAVVGHGGFGTTMTALAAGVPQLVLPLFASDQFLNAEQVAAIGAGVRLEGGLASLGEVAGLVAELLAEPGYADAARGVADEIATLPDVATMVDVLQHLAAGR